MSNVGERPAQAVAPELGPESQEVLSLSKACAGDRPSIFALGLTAAKAMERRGVAVLMVDVRGVVHLLPETAVQVLSNPTVPEEDLDSMTEEQAIQVLTLEGKSDDSMMVYLRGRDGRAK